MFCVSCTPCMMCCHVVLISTEKNIICFVSGFHTGRYCLCLTYKIKLKSFMRHTSHSTSSYYLNIKKGFAVFSCYTQLNCGVQRQLQTANWNMGSFLDLTCDCLVFCLVVSLYCWLSLGIQMQIQEPSHIATVIKTCFRVVIVKKGSKVFGSAFE